MMLLFLATMLQGYDREKFSVREKSSTGAVNCHSACINETKQVQNGINACSVT
jgi:hypothetical protein